MEQLARTLLEKLFADAEKADVGRRSRVPSLTMSHLTKYHVCRILQAKEAFETVMQAASAVGAVSIVMGEQGAAEGFIARVNLVDSKSLAGFLAKIPSDVLLANARQLLSQYLDRHPVLIDVLQQWEQLRSVRTYAAEDAKDWVDAIRIIDFAKENLAVGVVSVPINEASGKLFKDTKRIKKLVAPIDVLLAGDINAENRPADEVWGELGLFREEHPVRLSGKVIVEREGVCGYIDTPYIGLPAATIKRLGSTPSRVMTIENQTTFHSEARRYSNENVLLIYTAGMPNPPWREMYVRLLESLPNNIPVYHWGDVDEGGFRIASVLAREALKAGHVLQPWKMHPDDVPVDRRSAASTNTLNKMVHFAEAAGWGALGELVVAAGFTVEQESLG
jgi:hypothetical protein